MTVDLHPVGDPSSRGWGAGWPNCQTSKWVPVTLSNGVPIVGGLRREVAEMFTIIANECIKRGYHIYTPGCWGASCRQIAGTNQASLHSWGLAGDINAPTNPQQDHVGAAITDHPSWYVDLWNRYGWRNGSQYREPVRLDPMHNEFMGSPIDAVEMTRLARAELLTPPAPPQKEPPTMFMYLTADGKHAVLVGPDGKATIPPVSIANRLSRRGILYDVGDAGHGVSQAEEAWYQSKYGVPTS